MLTDDQRRRSLTFIKHGESNQHDTLCDCGEMQIFAENGWLTFITGAEFSTSREDSRTKIRYVVTSNNIIVDSGGLLGTEKQQVRDYLNGIHELAEFASE